MQHQQELQPPVELAVFEGLEFVRLRSVRGGAYVHAAEDGRSVRLDPRRESHSAVWAVRLRFCSDKAVHCVLLRGAYGRYLGAPDANVTATAAAGSFRSRSRYLCPLIPSPCRAAAQRDFDRSEILAILWRPVATGSQGVFQLRDASGRYLRANPRCLQPCRPGVSVSACSGLGKASQWMVEPVPRGGRPELPRPRQSVLGKLFAHVPLSGLCMRWFSEREIRYIRADDSGVFSEDADTWASTRYTGRTTLHLKRQLLNLLPPDVCPQYTLCVRAGRYGQPSPLAINLPRSRETLDVVLFRFSVTVEDRFIYPDVNAVAEAAADEEPLL